MNNYDYNNNLWKESPPHIAFLCIYKKIRKKGDRISPYVFQNIMIIDKELKCFFRYLVENEYLVEPSLNSALENFLNTDELKTLLKKRGLPYSGLKKSMIARLLANDEKGMRNIAGIDKLITCSDKARTVIYEFERHKIYEIDFNQEKCFELLLQGKFRKAYKLFIDLSRKYDNKKIIPNTYVLNDLQYTMESNPGSLNHIGDKDLLIIKSCKCMEIIWGKHCGDKYFTTEQWLDKKLGLNKYEYDIVLNHIAVNVKLKWKFSRLYGDMLKIKFDKNDIQSCEICKKYNDTIIDKEAFPEFPLKGCDSIYGCKFNVESHFEVCEEDEYDDSIDEDMFEIQTANNPVQMLKLLKEMLEEELITQEDYDKKKQALLERM